MPPRRDLTHVLKNLEGENTITRLELAVSERQKELRAEESRERNLVILSTIKSTFKAINAASTDAARRELGNSDAGQELLKLFGAVTTDDKIEDLNKSLVLANQNLAGATQRSQALQATHDADKSTIERLRSHRNTAVNESTQLKLRLTAQGNQVEMLERQNRELQSKSDDFKSRLDASVDSNRELLRLSDYAKDETADLRSTKQTLDSKISGLEADIVSLQRDLSDVRSNQSVQSLKNLEFQDSKLALEDRISELEANLTSLQGDSDREKSELADQVFVQSEKNEKQNDEGSERAE